MSKYVFVLMLSLMAVPALQARLGESPEKLSQRFGKPLQQNPSGVGDLRQHVYINKDLMITVLVTGNESVMEQYVRLKEVPKEGQKPVVVPIPENLAMAILAANAEGSEWTAFESSSALRRFVRKDQKGFASLTVEKGVITEVRISSTDMVDFAQKLRRP